MEKKIQQNKMLGPALQSLSEILNSIDMNLKVGIDK